MHAPPIVTAVARGHRRVAEQPSRARPPRPLALARRHDQRLGRRQRSTPALEERVNGQRAVVDRAAAVQVGGEHEDRVRDARRGVGEDVEVGQGDGRAGLGERVEEGGVEGGGWDQGVVGRHWGV